MLQVIISPAKQMRIATDAFAPRGIPPYPAQTARLHQELCDLERTQGPAGLKALWKVSDKLLAESLELLQAFTPIRVAAELNDPQVARNASAALFSYVGIQYRSMAPEVMDDDALAWLQEHLWIISGLYGCVRPFDAIEPYRLEMGAKLAVDGARNLYAFWGVRLARAVCGEVEEAPQIQRDLTGTEKAPHATSERGTADVLGASPVEAAETGLKTEPKTEEVAVINLASVEYAKAVLPHLPANTQAVTCIFGEALRDGKPVQRATASKIARGSMVRWMAEHHVEDARDLTRFDVGYRFAPKLSQRQGAQRALVFMNEDAT